MIYVCSLREMPDHAARIRPSHLVSLVAPDVQPPTPEGVSRENHHRVGINDITMPMEGYVHPDEHHIAALIQFFRGWHRQRPMLIHCLAGISRSTAAALIMLALDAEGRELQAARHLWNSAPHAYPNFQMIALADELLKREGRLIATRESIEEIVTVQEGPLVKLTLDF